MTQKCQKPRLASCDPAACGERRTHDFVFYSRSTRVPPLPAEVTVIIDMTTTPGPGDGRRSGGARSSRLGPPSGPRVPPQIRAGTTSVELVHTNRSTNCVASIAGPWRPRGGCPCPLWCLWAILGAIGGLLGPSAGLKPARTEPFHANGNRTVHYGSRK